MESKGNKQESHLKYTADRKIIHVDMDCFYAQVEERNNPELREKPVIIGGPTSTRGVVCTANYTARKFGVGSGQSTYEAFKKCPTLTLIHPKFDLYKRISADIRDIFFQYTNRVQSIGLDEAFLDLTNTSEFKGSATLIAKRIISEIWERTQLTCSAGVSFNKLVAKIASDCNKPNGICVVTPDRRLEFMKGLSVRKIPGVGPNSARMLHSINLKTAQDVMECSLPKLIPVLGANKATKIFHYCHGICYSEVEPFRLRQTFTSETTYYDLLRVTELDKAIDNLSVLFHHKFSALDSDHFQDRKIGRAVLKFRDEYFNTKTQTFSLSREESNFITTNRAWSDELLERIKANFKSVIGPQSEIRLLGLGIRFEDSHTQQIELGLVDEDE